MQQHVDRYVSQASANVHDVLVANETDATLRFLIPRGLLIVLVVVRVWQVYDCGQLFGGCGVPLDQGRREDLQTCVTELELECLVDACGTRDQRI